MKHHRAIGNSKMLEGEKMQTRPQRVTLSAISLFVVLSSGAFAQLFPKLPKIPGGIPKIPGVDRLLGKEPPVTTSLSDALTEVAFLDEFRLAHPLPLGVAAMGEDGSRELYPGEYTFEAQSYCLKAGTHGPGRGEGYIYGPLKGPKASIVRSILQRSTTRPDIPQKDIQVLLWAIIARTKITDMSPANQRTASELLTPKEMFELNGGALGLVPDSVREQAYQKLPPVARQVLEAEDRLRAMLTQGTSTYADLERVAVLLGDPPPSEDDRQLPSGRWSYHPDGYFVRFVPYGYSHTHVEIYVPEEFSIDRDESGRIVRVSDRSGNAIEVAYDTSMPAGGPEETASAFQSIRFIPGGWEASIRQPSVFQRTGFTLAGVPDERSRVPAGSGRFLDLERRRTDAVTHKHEFDQLIREVSAARKGRARSSDAAMRDLLDLANLREGIRDAAGGRLESDPRLAEQLDLLLRAWQFEFVKHVGGSPPQVASLFQVAGAIGSGGGGATKFDPSDTVAVPGETGRQRLVQSDRCQKPCECPDNKKICDALKKAAKTADDAVRADRDVWSNPSGSAANANSLKKKLGPQLKNLKDQLCAKGIDDISNTLDSLDPSKSTKLEERMKIARVATELDALVAQACGVPLPTPTAKPKTLCPDGREPDPGQEQAGKQITDALKKAYEDAKKELGDGNERVSQAKKLYEFWNQIIAAGCIPPEVMQAVKGMLSGNTDFCLNMCHETAKWVSEMTGNQSMVGAFFKECGARCP
jgi:hypothetical protein